MLQSLLFWSLATIFCGQSSAGAGRRASTLGRSGRSDKGKTFCDCALRCLDDAPSDFCMLCCVGFDPFLCGSKFPWLHTKFDAPCSVVLRFRCFASCVRHHTVLRSLWAGGKCTWHRMHMAPWMLVGSRDVIGHRVMLVGSRARPCVGWSGPTQVVSVTIR